MAPWLLLVGSSSKRIRLSDSTLQMAGRILGPPAPLWCPAPVIILSVCHPDKRFWCQFQNSVVSTLKEKLIAKNTQPESYRKIKMVYLVGREWSKTFSFSFLDSFFDNHLGLFDCQTMQVDCSDWASFVSIAIAQFFCFSKSGLWFLFYLTWLWRWLWLLFCWLLQSTCLLPSPFFLSPQEKEGRKEEEITATAQGDQHPLIGRARERSAREREREGALTFSDSSLALAPSPLLWASAASS